MKTLNLVSAVRQAPRLVAELTACRLWHEWDAPRALHIGDVRTCKRCGQSEKLEVDEGGVTAGLWVTVTDGTRRA